MDFRRAWLVPMAVALAAMVAATPAGADTRANRTSRPFGIQRPLRAMLLDTSRRIDVNQINMYVTNYGSFAWDIADQGQPPGLLYPKGTNKSAVFAAGLWLGASVGGEVRTVVAEYSQEYGPGAMVGGTFDDPGKPEYVTYKVARYADNPNDTAHVVRDANEATFQDGLVHHSWSEYMKGAVPYGAPWTTWKLPNTLTSDPADSVDVPGPSLEMGQNIMPDQMLWAVFNDADPEAHSNDAGNSLPLGVEVQQTTFAFNRQGALGNIVFLRWVIINKGGNQLDSMYVSIWSDTDLGGAADDLVGCDTTLSMGFTYNSTNNDQLYGSSPPAVGYDFFQGPLRHRFPGDDLELSMTSFNKYINGTDPASTSDTYNYMNGLLPDGSDVVDPTTGLPTKFFHPGDPTTRTGWLDSNPADRRHMLTSGPFYMSPGDTQVVVAALIVGNGSDRLSSVSAMKYYDEFAQLAFDEGFKLPNPPAQPAVSVDVDRGSVTLSWDARSRLAYREPGYAFEGYNVYQGSSVAGPWQRLATYDEVNGILSVRDTVFDVNTGQTITDYPVAFGTDAGIQYSYSTTQDAIRGGSLHAGTEYYYAVTAYAYSPTEKLAVVENAQAVVSVIPQGPALGTDPGTAATLCPTFLRVNPALPPTSDKIQLRVLDADSVTGDTYRVTYSDLPSPVVVDGTPVAIGWNLLDFTPVPPETLLKYQVNKSGDEDYRVIDGVQVKIVGSHTPANEFTGVQYFDASCNTISTPNLPVVGVSGGMEALGGGAGTAHAFFGSSTICDPCGEGTAATPDSFHTVEIRFSSTATQKAYRFFRRERQSDGGGARGYTYGGFHPVGFQVFDIVTGEQLDAAFVERLITGDDGTILPPSEQVATFDSTWAPDASELGGREYLFVIKRPYSDTEKPAIAYDGALVDSTQALMYAAWVHLESGAQIKSGEIFRYDWGATPGTANDIIEFETTPLIRENTSLVKSGLDRIRVVPNPYYNGSRYELNQFARVVRFMNMPEVATVRIFNLAGGLVRTLHKTDPTSSILNWDLLTENQLPVASGVYIYHIEAPGAGSTFGRMAVFMEKERLNNF